MEFRDQAMEVYEPQGYGSNIMLGFRRATAVSISTHELIGIIII